MRRVPRNVVVKVIDSLVLTDQILVHPGLMWEPKGKSAAGELLRRHDDDPAQMLGRAIVKGWGYSQATPSPSPSRSRL